MSYLSVKGFAWVPLEVLEEISLEAGRISPLETGGVLVGYWAESSEVIVTAASGPGPRAVHSKTRFTPDYAFQDRFIETAYAASGRRHGYLGDWHTHPKGSAKLSWLDKKTLRAISRSAQARAAAPIMMIVINGESDWEPVVWNYRRGGWREIDPFGQFVTLPLQTYRAHP